MPVQTVQRAFLYKAPLCKQTHREQHLSIYSGMERKVLAIPQNLPRDRCKKKIKYKLFQNTASRCYDTREIGLGFHGGI